MILKFEDLRIDVKSGIEFCGSEDRYLIILKLFVRTTKVKIANILVYLEQEDMVSYKIEVHSIKSSAASIGANDIFEYSKKLEQAAKDNDKSYIENNTEKYVKQVQELIDNIETILELESK